jgi:hypothetical protein
VRFKPVPEPPASLARLSDARRAVPLVPGTEADCCARLVDRLAVAREDARAWLTFMRALELVERTDAGFLRTDRDPEGEAVRTAFRERVFGAREVLDALGDGEPTGAEAAFEAVAATVPDWERARRGDWRAFWRERTDRLLGWAVLLGLARRHGDGFSSGPAYP